MTNTRRSFLGGFTGAVTGLTYSSAAAATPRQLRQLLAVMPSRENYWSLVAGQFPLRTGKIPMNAANLCPSPRVVSERVAEWTRDEDADVSNPNRTKFAVLLEESRKKVAEQMGVSPDEIALVRNTSEANNVINNGIALSSGDEVVLWEQNHPCNNVAWDIRAARHGFQVKRVAVPPAPRSTDDVVKLFEAALTPKTKVLSITYVSNTTGFRLPAKALCSLARQRGIHVHLDGAQVWGYLKLDLKDIGCDSFAASAHKWLMGPKEAGLLYVRKEKIPQIWPNIISVPWGQDSLKGSVASRKFEALGQRDDACLAAVGTAVDFHRILGLDNVEARTTELASTLKEGLAKIKRVKLVTPMTTEMSGGVVITQVEDFDRAKTGALVQNLYDKYGISGAATGGVRLAPHVYNTMADIELAIRGMHELLG
ncbi:MAG TPA: aminotransferase class V-fold PLP-dependent enzyme [Bryobacteraceae bacterium]|jgi:selenocysteine lyase/cysteine desulfurase